MQTSYSITNIETIVPGIDINPANINPSGPVPIDFKDTLWPGGTTLFLDGIPYAAGLSKRAFSPPLDLLMSIGTITKSFQIRPSQTAFLFSGSNESDLMVVDGNGLRYNLSLRKNNEKGGLWEAVGLDGTWKSTGFDPGKFTPDVWTQVTVVCAVNWIKSTSAILKITDGTTPFTIPNPVILPAAANTGWQKDLIDDQEQETEGPVAGPYTRDMRNISITMQ